MKNWGYFLRRQKSLIYEEEVSYNQHVIDGEKVYMIEMSNKIEDNTVNHSMKDEPESEMAIKPDPLPRVPT